MNALTSKNSSSSSSWNSEGNCEGDTYLLIQFARPVLPTTIKFQLQAGFSAQLCRVFALNATTVGACSISNDGSDCEDQHPSRTTVAPPSLFVDEIELEDVHEMQECTLQMNNKDIRIEAVQGLKLVLQDFTDFYGRVILYRLEIWGSETQPVA